jgi:hypothetical protein
MGFKILNSRTENEMKEFFNSYENLLTTQKSKTLDDITEWGDKLIGNIHRYMLKQKSLLELDYKNQIEFLNKTCKKFMTELHVHEQINNTEQINQLLERCNALKFKLVAIEYVPQNLPFIHLTREDIKYEDSVEIDESDTRNDKATKTTTATYDYDAVNNRSSYTNELTNSTFETAKQT